MTCDKKQLQLEIASLKAQVAKKDEVHIHEGAQAGVGMKNCSEDGKLINSSSSLNSKEVEKTSTNSLDLHEKDTELPSQTRSLHLKLVRTRLELCDTRL